jgi:PKD repeat protein
MHIKTGDINGDGAPNIAAITFGFDGIVYAFGSLIDNINPIAQYTFEPSNPASGETVYFNSTSYDFDGTIVNWTWDFGDGNLAYDEQVTHAYTADGVYYHSLTVTDDGGATDFESSTIIVGNVTFISIDFEIGWNLITLPVNNGWNASDLAANITGSLSVSGWDAVNQTYKTYIVGGPPSFDFMLSDGYGYFVDLTSASTSIIEGNPIQSVIIPLKIGWNLIGWYHDNDTLASSIAENITGSLSVSGWDAINQTYKTFIVGGPPSFDFIVSQNMGLFVDVTVESNWQGEG